MYHYVPDTEKHVWQLGSAVAAGAQHYCCLPVPGPAAAAAPVHPEPAKPAAPSHTL